jgi:hypothetical protein
MPYAYYSRLNKSDRAIYRRSDTIGKIALAAPSRIRPIAVRLQRDLGREDRRAVDDDVRALCDAVVADVGAAPLIAKVLATRPSDDYGELHGLYEPAEGRRRARLTVWMRTARHRRVVAFRTFLRTVLHELCHHLDYEILGLTDSFHTRGFFMRESSLFRQLVGTPGPRARSGS